MTRPPDKKNQLIGAGLPALALALTVAAFFAFRPGVEASAIQLNKSGKAREALKLIRTAKASGARDPGDRLTRLELDILGELFQKEDAGAQRDIWAETLALHAHPATGDIARDTLVRMTLDLKNPAGLWQEHRAAITAPAARPVLEAMITRLLGVGRPAAAAALLAASIEENPPAPAADRLRLAGLWRQSARPDLALAALEGLSAGETTPETDALRLALLHEVGREKAALKLYAQGLLARTTNTEDIVELRRLALAAGDFDTPLPVLEKHLAANPDDLRAHRILSDLLADAGKPVEARREFAASMRDNPDDPARLPRLFELSEWAGENREAQDALLRLAIHGDRAALMKISSFTTIPADPALPSRLADAVAKPGREADLVPVAEFLALIGEYARSAELYRLHLLKTPDDVAALSARAMILEEIGETAEALPPLRRAVDLMPADLALRRRLAALLLVENRPLEALAEYARIAREAPDRDSVFAHLRLAESLGRTGEAADDAERLVAPDMNPEANDFLLAQTLATAAGRRADALAVLKAGLGKFPGNTTLRRTLAIGLSDATDYAGALAVMREHPGLRSDPTAASLWLDLMRLTDSRADEAAYFAEGMPAIVAGSPALRLRAARALAAIGRTPEALEMQRALSEEFPADKSILREYLGTLIATGKRVEALRLFRERLDDDTPESLALAASVLAENHDYSGAGRKLSRLIAIPGQDTSQNLSLLGDMLTSAGDTRGARQAYAKALAKLTGSGPAKKGES